MQRMIKASATPSRFYKKSDLDVIVSFDGPATSKQYFGVKFYLEDKLGVDVDLVTDKAIKEALRPYIVDPEKCQ